MCGKSQSDRHYELSRRDPERDRASHPVQPKRYPQGISRNHGERGYRPAQAGRPATERKSSKRIRPEVMDGIIKSEVEAHLRINGKRRYRRRSKLVRGGKIPNRVDIEKRPDVISERGATGTGRPTSFNEAVSSSQ